MNLWELFVIAVGLSMDAFAVSICKGLSTPRLRLRHSLICGVYFGLFQALMPLLGWLLGVRFQAMIASLDHWIAFILLGIIGVNMIRESRECGEESLNSSFSFRTMLPLAVATSIDALAVGVTFAFLQVDIVPAVLFIGCTTFVISAVGVKVGAVFGARFQHQALHRPQRGLLRPGRRGAGADGDKNPGGAPDGRLSLSAGQIPHFQPGFSCDSSAPVIQWAYFRKRPANRSREKKKKGCVLL